MAVVKPHKPVSSCTIAHWLKCVLGDSGIDVSMFAAHSVRGASSSAAAMAGVTTNDIQIGVLIRFSGVSITNLYIFQILVMLCYLLGSLSMIS